MTTTTTSAARRRQLRIAQEMGLAYKRFTYMLPDGDLFSADASTEAGAHEVLLAELGQVADTEARLVAVEVVEMPLVAVQHLPGHCLRLIDHGLRHVNISTL